MYRDTRFRSRLEARWAAFFDLVGWRWTYEPLDADGYIPDFLVHGERPHLVEVGPCLGYEELVAKAAKAQDAFPAVVHTCNREWQHRGGACVHESFATRRERGVLIVGVAPAIGCHQTDDGFGHEGWAWLAPCGRCGVLAVCNGASLHGQPLTPCGHPDGPEWLDGRTQQGLLETLWRRAGNDVAWPGRQHIGGFPAGGR